MRKGLVIKSTGSWFTVADGDEIFQCRIKGKFRIKNIVTTNPVTVGDRVHFEVLADGTGMIRKIEPRTNYIIRRSTSFNKEAHLLAANLDQAVVMVSLKNPATPREFIDRFLVTAEAYHIESIILINKIDLLEKENIKDLEEFVKTYSLAGYTCIQTCVPQKKNLAEVEQLLKGKLSLVAGNSGVGKSSLLNALNPALELKTAEISSYHKSGKHTTTFSEMFRLDDNTHVVDSPGIRGFGLIDIKKEELGLYFPEIFTISKDCKFYNCTHMHEPGCAVEEAVKEGRIGLSRFNSYLNMMTEDSSKYR